MRDLTSCTEWWLCLQSGEMTQRCFFGHQYSLWHACAGWLHGWRPVSARSTESEVDPGAGTSSSLNSCGHNKRDLLVDFPPS